MSQTPLLSQDQYPQLLSSLASLSESERSSHLRWLCRNDLYFLLRYACQREDMEHPWIFARCREFQANPNGYLDLWAREHYKSTIITFGYTILEILATHGEGSTGPEVTVGIFSYSQKFATQFLLQIKRELETNQLLKRLFPDVLHDKTPDNGWSGSALVVKRRGNPKEPTVGAHGLTDGMPTGVHYNRMIYDDVVVLEGVATPEQIQKTTTGWEHSTFLGTKDGLRRYIGTRYHYNDTYRTILERSAAIPRIHKATDNGELDGDPILLPEKRWKEILKAGPYVVACQMLQDPRADKSAGLQRSWLKFTDILHTRGMNLYILVDPANSKSKKSDWTAINVIGIGADGNKYWIDAVRDRLNMHQRTEALFELHRKYRPLRVGYEKYGMQTDIEYIKRIQAEQNYRFDIVELGGSMGKNDRIRRMVPDLVEGRWWWPREMLKKLEYDNQVHDIVDMTLREEYDQFPVPQHDDTLDCMSRIYDEAMYVIAPKSLPETDRYSNRRRTNRPTSWMTR